MRVSRTLCDRCHKEIKYIGWTGIIKEPKPKRLRIVEILNGNPSGYDYCNIDQELCADCMESFKKWLKADMRGTENESSD